MAFVATFWKIARFFHNYIFYLKIFFRLFFQVMGEWRRETPIKSILALASCEDFLHPKLAIF